MRNFFFKKSLFNDFLIFCDTGLYTWFKSCEISPKKCSISYLRRKSHSIFKQSRLRISILRWDFVAYTQIGYKIEFTDCNMATHRTSTGKKSPLSIIIAVNFIKIYRLKTNIKIEKLRKQQILFRIFKVNGLKWRDIGDSWNNTWLCNSFLRNAAFFHWKLENSDFVWANEHTQWLR